jgi:hypothetical protein
MTRQDESDPITPHRLNHEFDDIAGLADALAIVSDVEGVRSKRAIGALANEVSRISMPLTPKRLGSELDRSLDRHGTVADNCFSARCPPFWMAERDHDISSRGTHDPGHHRRLDRPAFTRIDTGELSKFVARCIRGGFRLIADG